MKKFNVIVSILLVLVAAITGCGTEQPNKVVPKEKVEKEQQMEIKDKSQWQEYVNSRFGYSINFPKTWYKGSSSQNNDGIVLHAENKSFDIRVYGSNYLEGFSKPYSNLEKEGFNEKEIILNNGQSAKLITGEEDDMLVYEMVYLSGSVEYHFYAKVSKEYASEYEGVILEVIKTFNPDLRGEEKPFIEENEAKKIIEQKTKKVINAIAKSAMEELSGYIHPQKGVRFTPYTNISIDNDLVFTKKQISNFMQDNKKYLWGYYDGSGFEIKLTPKEYWQEFVYDKDFKSANKISYNKIIGRSLMKENQFKVYPDSIIVEYYKEGTNPEFEGLDWASLRIVFEKLDGKWYVVGIIHNEHVI